VLFPEEFENVLGNIAQKDKWTLYEENNRNIPLAFWKSLYGWTIVCICQNYWLSSHNCWLFLSKKTPTNHTIGSWMWRGLHHWVTHNYMDWMKCDFMGNVFLKSCTNLFIFTWRDLCIYVMVCLAVIFYNVNILAHLSIIAFSEKVVVLASF